MSSTLQSVTDVTAASARALAGAVQTGELTSVEIVEAHLQRIGVVNSRLNAVGGSPLGMGTDAAGSIRVPAHFCGIAGLKPTRGRVPLTGAFPPTVGHTGPLWHAGPLARRVEDLVLALGILDGPDGHDPS